jgi:hypothetical protein
MEFTEDLKAFVEILEKREDYSTDVAFRSVVELFKSLTSRTDLSRQKDLINRIVIDNVESWETINLISSFMTRHAQ